MLNIAFALAVATLTSPVGTQTPKMVSATNPESASGFRDLAHCEEPIGGLEEPLGKASTRKDSSRLGSRFNRAAGNLSRCESIDGEYLVVIYLGKPEDKRPGL